MILNASVLIHCIYDAQLQKLMQFSLLSFTLDCLLASIFLLFFFMLYIRPNGNPICPYCLIQVCYHLVHMFNFHDIYYRPNVFYTKTRKSKVKMHSWAKHSHNKDFIPRHKQVCYLTTILIKNYFTSRYK